MNLRPRCPSGLARLALCTLSMLGFAALVRPVQAQQVSVAFAQGTHLFRRILHDLNLQPLRGFGQLNDPANKLLIVLGEAESVRSRLDLQRFVERGGAVLVATDRKCVELLQPFGIRVIGNLMKADRPRYIYKGLDECVFIQPSDNASFLFENLSVEDHLSQVATNRSGYLLLFGDHKPRVLATFPPGCFPLTEGGTHIRIRTFPFAAGGDWGKGRILVLADHSVFINAMMWQPDIENFDFAYNCVNWLTERGKRNEVLFLEEGEVQSSFEVPLKEPPLPPLKTIVEAMDKGLGQLESDDVFNRMIQKTVTEIATPADKWLRALILISTAFLGLFALARLSQARHRPEKAPSPAAAVPEGTLPGSVLDQRHQAMEQEGNYWEAARTLARQGLEPALAISLPANSQATVGKASLPTLNVPGGWWRNWRQRRRFKRLWQLAFGTEPVRISARQLQRLGPEIEAMKGMLARSHLSSGSPQSRRA